MTGYGMSEAAWQSRVVEYAHWLQLDVFHSGDSRRDTSAGYPDLTMVGPNGVLWAELKREDGRVTPEQVRWIARLRDTGHDAYIWRPSDWDAVSLRLRQLAGRAPYPTISKTRETA